MSHQKCTPTHRTEGRFEYSHLSTQFQSQADSGTCILANLLGTPIRSLKMHPPTHELNTDTPINWHTGSAVLGTVNIQVEMGDTGFEPVTSSV